MESVESEISSLDEESREESSSLLNHDFSLESADYDGKSNLNEFIDDTEDTRSDLRFDKVVETEEEVAKRLQIVEALENSNSTLKVWRKLALEDYGLVGDDLRCKIWPLLLEVDPSTTEVTPLLEELVGHHEYNQVVLDVNRSLKRFPPGIPYNKRLALQDQLTVLILRVIMKYPSLRYYQGYHDVAITFLLVVGEAVAFRIMERLSTEHFKECMEPTMEKTSYRLNYIYALLQKVDLKLHNFMDEACVGTMFALPWFLTWFGHSLNRYKDVVRLYDFFLASPPLMSLYVATSLVVERREEVLMESCDMASIHCCLLRIPDDLNFENILKRASQYYTKFPPEKLEKAVKKRIQNEMVQRKKDEDRMRRRLNKNKNMWLRLNDCMPSWLMMNTRSRYGLLFATATVLVGLYAYYLKTTKAKYSLFGLWNT